MDKKQTANKGRKATGTKKTAAKKPAAKKSDAVVNKPIAQKRPTKGIGLITGADLMSFFMQSGLPTGTVQTLLGMSKLKWDSETGSTEPLKDPTSSMLLRLFLKNPQLVPKRIDIQEFFSQIGGHHAIRPADFALIMGREKSAYSRWLSGTNSISATLESLIRSAMSLSNNDPIKAFEIIKDLYLEESSSRGIDPLVDGNWGSR